jgi:hypothetical protein
MHALSIFQAGCIVIFGLTFLLCGWRNFSRDVTPQFSPFEKDTHILGPHIIVGPIQNIVDRTGRIIECGRHLRHGNNFFWLKSIGCHKGIYMGVSLAVRGVDEVYLDRVWQEQKLRCELG